MKSKRIKLFANCIPVKGHNRSVICDLQRNNIVFIPNDLFDILKYHDGKRINEIKNIFKNKYNDVIDEYLDFLIKKELIFFTDNSELFPILDSNWHEPVLINNAILDVNNLTNYSVEFALEQLENLKCPHLEIRIFNDSNLKNLQHILSFIESNCPNLGTIDFLIPYSIALCDSYLFGLISKHHQITSFKVFNSDKNKFIYPKEKGYIIYNESEINSCKYCGIISPDYFTINIKSFFENKHFNSCLNRKISVDVNGEIKNCPSMAYGFGKIGDKSLEEVLSNDKFINLWKIGKNEIEICKICEFRYICSDCRAYVEDPNNIYSKPLKCGYNPITSIWENWSLNPLKNKSIEYYNLKENKN